MGGPYHQPTISHSGRRLTIGSDSEPDTGDAVVDSASSTRRFLFSHGHSRHREGSQQPEFDRRYSQPYGQREGQSLTLCLRVCMCVCDCALCTVYSVHVHTYMYTCMYCKSQIFRC